MEKEKFPRKHIPGSKYPGIDDKDIIRVQLAFWNPWKGKVIPGKFILPDGREILTWNI